VSQENVEIVERINAAFNSGDIDNLLARIDDDFETTVPPEFSAEPDTYRGPDGMRRYFDSFREAMREIRFHQETVRDAGSSVVVAVRLTAVGRTTAIPVEQRFAQVWSLRGGKAVSVRTYPSVSEALEAARLEDQPRPPSGES
jgi:ketosteroid isomerase-like protein